MISVGDLNSIKAIGSPAYYADVFGTSTRYAQKACKAGKIKAAFVDGRWHIDMRAALKAHGIDLKEVAPNE